MSRLRSYATSQPMWRLAALLLVLTAAVAVSSTLISPAGAHDGAHPPAKPGGLTVSTDPGSLDVSVDWADVDGAEDYLVRWRSAGQGQALNDGVRVGTSAADIHVASYGEWVVRVQACNDAGCGKPAATRFEVRAAPESKPKPITAPTPEPTPTPTPIPVAAPTPEPVPGKPKGLTATTEPGSLDVSLDWDDVAGADSYTVWWRKTFDVRLRGQTSVQSSDAAITVDRYGDWIVSVRACNGDSCGQGEAQLVRVVEAPAKPSGLGSTTEPDSLHVSLDWDDVAGADSYTVRWRERVPGARLNEGVSVTTSSASITVTGSGEWVARVTACSGDDCGPGGFTRFQVTTPCANGVIIPNPDNNLELVADCEALWAARDILNPEGDVLVNWNAETALWHWKGVTTGGSPQRVTHMDFGYMGLGGSIPAAVGKLTGLNWLGFEKSSLTGGVPSELGNLTNLTELSVSYNELTGSVPASLAKLTNLWSLHLNNNQFTGTIPSEYGNLNTEHFHLSHNRFSGSIPPELSNIDNLGGLFLDNNQLTGEIPDELKDAEFIHTFALGNNQLTGELPDWLGSKPYLVLTLHNNRFTGPIPDLSGLSYVRELKLGGNTLSGCVSDALRGRFYYSSTPPYGDVGAPFCADGALEAAD